MRWMFWFLWDRSDETMKKHRQFTPQARKRWDAIPKGMQFRLLNNVFCVQCRGEVSMLEHTGRIEDGFLLLEGCCFRCGGDVARAIER